MHPRYSKIPSSKTSIMTKKCSKNEGKIYLGPKLNLIQQRGSLCISLIPLIDSDTTKQQKVANLKQIPIGEFACYAQGW